MFQSEVLQQWLVGGGVLPEEQEGEYFPVVAESKADVDESFLSVHGRIWIAPKRGYPGTCQIIQCVLLPLLHF